MVIYPVLVPENRMVVVIVVFPSQKRFEMVVNQIILISVCLSVSFPFFLPQSLIEAHDKVAAKCFEMPLAMVNSDAQMTSSLMSADAVRMIGIQKKAGEPLVS